MSRVIVFNLANGDPFVPSRRQTVDYKVCKQTKCTREVVGECWIDGCDVLCVRHMMDALDQRVNSDLAGDTTEHAECIGNQGDHLFFANITERWCPGCMDYVEIERSGDEEEKTPFQILECEVAGEVLEYEVCSGCANAPV